MIFSKIKIPNKENELLDTWIEGNGKSKVTIIFVHGFATDKHETGRYFDDVTVALKEKFRIIRFDFSGCGNSEGKLEDKNYLKWAEDLDSVLTNIENNYPGGIYILAQSMGCFVTTLLSPLNVKKTVFIGLPNSDTKYIGERLVSRFISRPGGKLDYKGISIFPRSSGQIQKIGTSFWKALFDFNPVEKVSEFSKKTSLMIIHPQQDEIVGNKHLEKYSQIKGVVIEKLNGDHAFSKPEDRNELIQTVKNFFLLSV
ncbi:MAG: serine peptidase [Candidatus Roizmanbacteria bacterium GW2011_GWA2_35_8]|uniref:Serine peptidase n=1 Tax=Candidatus Roizmanbacteria bacterium GW2011_GWA2_35_8 TaxID=1618479 RepID=A0A0G0FID7_9BACT|nr:MAG: serine peptidase [Candidatus Roizmanbacteria bacterium GW2011_GWA2_35_8]